MLFIRDECSSNTITVSAVVLFNGTVNTRIVYAVAKYQSTCNSRDLGQIIQEGDAITTQQLLCNNIIIIIPMSDSD